MKSLKFDMEHSFYSSDSLYGSGMRNRYCISCATPINFVKVYMLWRIYVWMHELLNFNVEERYMFYSNSEFLFFYFFNVL